MLLVGLPANAVQGGMDAQGIREALSASSPAGVVTEGRSLLDQPAAVGMARTSARASHGDSSARYQSSRASVDPKVGLRLQDKSGLQLNVVALDAIGAGKGAAIDGDTIAYAIPGTSYGFAAQGLGEGRGRLLAVIGDRMAPEQYRYRVTGDQPIILSDSPQVEGGLEIRNEKGERIGHVEPAWAFDADGVAVPTFYTVEGEDVIVQHVQHQGSAYPVVADPSVGLGWYVYIRLSPADQRFILQGGPVVVGGLICLATAGTGCVIAVTSAAIIAIAVAEYFNPSCWIELRFTYAGNLAGVNSCWRAA